MLRKYKHKRAIRTIRVVNSSCHCKTLLKRTKLHTVTFLYNLKYAVCKVQFNIIIPTNSSVNNHNIPGSENLRIIQRYRYTVVE